MNVAGAARFAALLLAGCASAPQLHGTPLPQRAAPPFTLTDQNGHAHALRSDAGKVVLLYFGFTHCKDVCPQTLQKLERATRESGLGPGVTTLFVSVDPARDTTAAMRDFLLRRNSSAVGLTGTLARLRSVWRSYGVDVRAERNDIGHGSSVYVISRDGMLRELLHDDTAVTAIASDLRTIVS